MFFEIKLQNAIFSWQKSSIARNKKHLNFVHVCLQTTVKNILLKCRIQHFKQCFIFFICKSWFILKQFHNYSWRKKCSIWIATFQKMNKDNYQAKYTMKICAWKLWISPLGGLSATATTTQPSCCSTKDIVEKVYEENCQLGLQKTCRKWTNMVLQLLPFLNFFKERDLLCNKGV